MTAFLEAALVLSGSTLIAVVLVCAALLSVVVLVRMARPFVRSVLARHPRVRKFLGTFLLCCGAALLQTAAIFCASVAVLFPELVNSFMTHTPIRIGAETSGLDQDVGLFLKLGYIFYAALILLTVWRGWRLGAGDWVSGLSLGPMRRIPLAVWLYGLAAVLNVALTLLVEHVPMLRDFARSTEPEWMTHLDEARAGDIAALIVVVAIVAPVSEELFFRGWFWEALRKRGHGIATIGAITTISFLMLHGSRGLLLIPVGLILFAARYLCGSVKASLGVHVANNATAVLMVFVSTLVK